MTLRTGVLLLALVLVAVDLATPGHGAGWHAWPGFGLVYGLVTCVAIVLVSKALGRAGIQRAETFYDEGGRDDGGAA